MPRRSIQLQYDEIIQHYESRIAATFPDQMDRWPLINGFDTEVATLGGWSIVVFRDKPRTNIFSPRRHGEIPPGTVGTESIDSFNRSRIRKILEDYLSLGARDALIFVTPDNQCEFTEVEAMLQRHAQNLGVSPLRIFLSHKGSAKPRVREFYECLRLAGLEPWLDSADLNAGHELERGLLNGFKSSCAAVFFISKDFRDESFIATEVNFAIQQKREKASKFAIITIVLADGAPQHVPELLRQYVWKEVATDLEALAVLLRGLPIRPGPPQWV